MDKPDGLDEHAALLLETFARFGMQHVFKDGKETPNAKLARETAAALRSRPAQEDSARLDWLIDNCPYWPLDGGNALPTVSRAAIDVARKSESEHG